MGTSPFSRSCANIIIVILACFQSGVCVCVCISVRLQVGNYRVQKHWLGGVASGCFPSPWSGKGRAGTWSDEPRVSRRRLLPPDQRGGAGVGKSRRFLPSHQRKRKRLKGGDRSRCFQRLLHGLPRFRHPASGMAAANGREGKPKALWETATFVPACFLSLRPPKTTGQTGKTNRGVFTKEVNSVLLLQAAYSPLTRRCFTASVGNF